MNSNLSKPANRLLIAYIVVAALWRLVGLVWIDRSPLLSQGADPRSTSLLFASGLMGLGWIGLGLLALVRVRTIAAGLLALGSVSAGIHFGGPLPTAVGVLQEPVWLFYLIAGTVLASTVLLHFVTVFPRVLRPLRYRGSTFALYLPFTLALAAAGCVLALPTTSELGRSLRTLILDIEIWQSKAYLGLALILVPIGYFRSSPPDRRLLGLDLMLLGLCAGFVPWAAVRVLELVSPQPTARLGITSEPLELLFVLIPMGFCSALIHDAESKLHAVDSGQ